MTAAASGDRQRCQDRESPHGFSAPPLIPTRASPC
jgi:hypothetical protein